MSKVGEQLMENSPQPWLAQVHEELRALLTTEVSRLSAEVESAESELQGLLRDSGAGAGDDQADAGSKNLERDQEISLTNNSRELLDQSRRALARLDDGSYGVCESCGESIGQLRVLAFPRATLCMSCKQQQERR